MSMIRKGDRVCHRQFGHGVVLTTQASTAEVLLDSDMYATVSIERLTKLNAGGAS